MNLYYVSNENESDNHSVMSDSLQPMDCTLPVSSVHGILQARILERVAISLSRGSSWPMDQTQVSCTAGTSFTISVTKKAPIYSIVSLN